MNGLILLFGMPRSGTTWIGKIVDSHPMTLYKHEPDTLKRIPDVPLLPKLEDIDRFAPSIAGYMSEVRRIRASRVCGKSPMFPKAYYSLVQWRFLCLSRSFAKLGERIHPEFPLVGVPCAASVQGHRVVWKSIESLGRLGVLMQTLGDVHAVHIVRHPCGYVASVLRGEARHKFDDARPSSEDYGLLNQLARTVQARRRGLTVEALSRMRPVERLAWRWAIFNEKAMEESGGNQRYSIVRYEDFCREPVDNAKLLFDRLGLGWNGQTEAFVVRSTTMDRPSYYGVYKDPTRAANRWQQELEKDDIAQIMSIASQTQPGQLYESAPSGD